jgi:hypothetical protein
MTNSGGYVLGSEMEKCLGALDIGHLRGFLGTRGRDRLIRKSIDQWLKAGALEEGTGKRNVSGLSDV